MRFGKANDEFFVRFIEAKEEDDVESAKALLSDLNSLSDADRKELSELYADVEDYIADMEADMEADYAFAY